MALSEIKDWLIPASVFISLIGVTIKFWQASNEFKIKLQSEVRRQKSAQAENDTKLLKLFTEIMGIAHGRGGYVVSEKTIESLFSNKMITDFKDLNKKIAESSVITIPVGAAEQASAFAAIGILGRKHEILQTIAKEALESLKHVNKELSEKYLKEIETA